MKNRAWIAAVSAVLLSASLWAADAIKLDGINCVVAGNKPAKAGTEVDYKGGKVFFCCTNCPTAFKKETAKFAEKANHQLAATKQAKQVKCPLSGKDLNPAVSLKISGVEVAFCCEGCLGEVSSAKAAEQPGLVFNDKTFEKSFKVGKSE